MTTTPLRIAIIGCGAISHDQANALSRIPHAKLALVHDLDDVRGSRFAQQYGAEWTERLDDVLARQDIDAVIVSTPTDTHHDIALAAAVAGKHILVEKPAALTLPGLDAMQRASDNAGVVLMAGHILRFDPMITALHDSIAAGELGKPVLFNWISNTSRPWPAGWRAWQTDPAKSGGMTLHLGIHGIDLALWLMDSLPQHVYAQGANLAAPSLDVYDYFHVTIRFQNGTNALLESNSNLLGIGNQYRAFTMYGTEGQAQWKQTDDGLIIDGHGGHSPRAGLVDIMEREIRHFVDCCQEQQQPLITPEQTRWGLAAAIAASRSLETGQSVNLSDVIVIEEA